MKKTRHTPNEDITKLRKVEGPRADDRMVTDAGRDTGAGYQTYYGWKSEYGSIDRDQLKRLNDIEK